MPSPEFDGLADESVATVRRWLAASGDAPADPSAQRLAGLLKDPLGLEFTVGFVDRVVRPEDLRVAARNLERLSRRVPRFLPWYLRGAVVLGGGFAPLLPWPIVPIARRVFRGMVGHLVVDASPKALDRSLSRLRGRGIRLNLNLLGEAVLGDEEAGRRLAGTRALLERRDVDYVSIKVSSIASQLSMWAFDDMVDTVVQRLTPLYEVAAASPTSKFINLDMEEYRDLDLTVAVFTRLLDQPSLKNLEAGIVLQAYLPDALGALQQLTEWAVRRRAAGGAGIKVRVVKGANLAMERVDSALHDWPLATWGSKQQTDANYKRVLDWAFTPERADAVRIGVAGHNLFDVAFAWLLAKRRRVEHRIEFEMLLGMATGQADAVRQDVGGLLLYTPVVHPHEFDAAISYLMRRLEENASTENFMSGVFELDDAGVFAREEQRFRASLVGVDDTVPAPHRVPQRDSLPVPPAAFANEADTDPSVAANRAWGAAVLARMPVSTLGADTLEAAAVRSASELERIVADAVGAGSGWAARPAADRARVLRDAADVLGAFRGRLVEVMGSETGKAIAEGDVEVSEAIDFARYYADRALELESVEGAAYAPPRLTLVTPPWNFPVAIPAGGVLAALAAGSAVVLKPAPQARRSGAVLAEALWEAGVPRDVLVLMDVAEGDLGQQLIAHPAVDRVILTGAYETARLFRSWRPDLPLIAETSGKNAIVVTPSADLDLAVGDVVRSAFGHAGQKCSAASLVILVGSVARSERFLRQLEDATRTLRVGWPEAASTQMGPVIEPAAGKLLDGLTTLGEGESWLLQPRRLDDTGRLWSPGIRTGVKAGSAFHRTEYFGPILGVMTAATLDEALDLQNAVEYGLTAGIHSLDPAEVATWLDRVQAGNLYVNRGITGAIVRRQPFGGWKRSTVGPSAKAGGPNYLAALGRWAAVETEPHENITLDRMSEPVASVIKKAQSGMTFPEFDRVRTAARSDERAWREEFGVSRDVSGLGVERNVFRYRPVPVLVRLSEGEPVGHAVRLLVAAARAGAPVDISTSVPLPATLVRSFDAAVPAVRVRSVAVETDAAFVARAGSLSAARIRLVGGDPAAIAAAVDADVAIWSGPVTTAGRVELLPFLHEQAVSITAHRFGNPDPAFETLEV
jgi:RHH-type transcriptional regulator, proline utilization regulon repressor / proline dehydrogenase / delta 1-pyrroline-5-carboxylate dehydrogenase